MTFVKPPLPFSPYLKVDWSADGKQETLYLKSVVQARDAEMLRAVAEFLDRKALHIVQRAEETAAAMYQGEDVEEESHAYVDGAKADAWNLTVCAAELRKAAEQ